MGIATHHAMRALHLTDTVTTCDCCGRANLKATVLMLRDDGGTAHYGRTCAARNSGKTSKQIQVEIYAEEPGSSSASARCRPMPRPSRHSTPTT